MTSWATKADRPIDFWHGAAGVHPLTGFIFVAGGQSLNGMTTTNRKRTDSYNPADNTWDQVADLPVLVHHGGYAADPDGQLYVWCGYTGPNSVPSNQTFRYSPTANTWTELAVYGPNARSEIAGAFAGGRVYSFGGLQDPDTALAGCKSYDPSTDTWTAIADLPVALCLAAAAPDSSGRYIYVFGGSTGSNPNSRAQSTVYQYDTTNDTYATRAPMPTKRAAAVAVLGSDGLIYVVGGQDNTGAVQRTTYIYDPAADTWTTGPQIPQARMSMAGAASGTDVFVFGGADATGATQPDTYSYFTSRPPTADVIAPSGDQTTTSRPTVKWTYSDPDGDPQEQYHVKFFDATAYSAAGFDPETATATFDTGAVSSAGTSYTPGSDLTNYTAWRAYVKVMSQGQWSAWAYSDFRIWRAPFAPTITSPDNGAVMDLSAGFNISWVNSYPSGVGSQSAVLIRRKTATGSWEWWSGSAWVATETKRATTALNYSFGAGQVDNQQYTFAVAIQDSEGQQSPYSTGTTVVGSAAASVTVTSPSGAITTVRPTGEWSVSDPEGDPQQTYQARWIRSDVYALAGFDPGLSTAVADTGEIADADARSTVCPVDLDITYSYRLYVRVTTAGQYSAWAYSEFSISITPPVTPTVRVSLATHPTSPLLSRAQIDVYGHDNILTPNEANGTGGWALDGATGTAVNATPEPLAISNYSVAVTGTSGIQPGSALPAPDGTHYVGAISSVPVDPTPPRDFTATLAFYDDTGTHISDSVGQVATEVAGQAVRATVSADAPAGTALIRLKIDWTGALDTDVHHAFDAVLRPTLADDPAMTDWSPGGFVGASSTTVTRDDGAIVRGGLDVTFTDAGQHTTVFDDEGVPGRPTSYSAHVTAIVGVDQLVSPESAASAEVTWTIGFLVLSDPLDPQTAPLVLAPQSWDVVNRPARQGVYRPLSRADAVFISGVRGLRESSLVLVIPDRATREAYIDLVSRQKVLLMRTPPDAINGNGLDAEGDAIYIMPTGDIPLTHPTPGRAPQRTVTLPWTEQPRPQVTVTS